MAPRDRVPRVTADRTVRAVTAGVRAGAVTYAQSIHALKLANIDLDRKVLADIAMHEGEAFKAIVAQAKAALPKAA